MAELEPHHEVATFAAAHGDSLLRFAYLLTGGDAAEAEDLVCHAQTTRSPGLHLPCGSIRRGGLG
jgi:hypothetical protein